MRGIRTPTYPDAIRRTRSDLRVSTMRGIRTPTYPALPECSAVKTSMVAPKFNACREADVETLPVALHSSPWSLGRSTPIHHATLF